MSVGGTIAVTAAGHAAGVPVADLPCGIAGQLVLNAGGLSRHAAEKDLSFANGVVALPA